VARRAVPPGPLTLTVDVRTTGLLPPSVTGTAHPADGPAGVGAHGPDVLVFSVGAPGDDGPGEEVARLDGRYLSTQVATGFTGRVIGMYVTEGSAAFDWFDYRPGAGAGAAG
jgi:hypothetical protein